MLFRLISPFTHQWEKARRIARFSCRCRWVTRFAKRTRLWLSSDIFALAKRTLSSVDEQAVRFDDLKDAEMKRRQRGAKPPTMKILWVFREFSLDIRMSWMFARQGISLTGEYSQFGLCGNAYIRLHDVILLCTSLIFRDWHKTHSYIIAKKLIISCCNG